MENFLEPSPIRQAAERAPPTASPTKAAFEESWCPKSHGSPPQARLVGGKSEWILECEWLGIMEHPPSMAGNRIRTMTIGLEWNIL